MDEEQSSLKILVMDMYDSCNGVGTTDEIATDHLNL